MDAAMDAAMDLDSYTRFGLALLAVIGLILLTAALARRFGPMGVGGGGSGRGRPGRPRRRLGVIESAMVDTRRRLVLVRCDDREHLLLIGGTHDLVIDRDSARPAGPAEVDAADPDDPVPAPASPSFRTILRRGQEGDP